MHNRKRRWLTRLWSCGIPNYRKLSLLFGFSLGRLLQDSCVASWNCHSRVVKGFHLGRCGLTAVINSRVRVGPLCNGVQGCPLVHFVSRICGFSVGAWDPKIHAVLASVAAWTRAQKHAAFLHEWNNAGVLTISNAGLDNIWSTTALIMGQMESQPCRSSREDSINR